ncbi:hypothetical protein PHYPO_G00069750 [Pangasianodon hypophthalmus]|uniref:PGC-1 and ERR-induced regulator in muscle protein 1 n=1 Tax=Pangasianodon hypophthalmus TaxID=310915 RepID=A0A5N5LU80_PANHP|nr:hypothetical protein PHYPO_G00069750 [Pangasianodon hypophthalmus]
MIYLSWEGQSEGRCVYYVIRNTVLFKAHHKAHVRLLSVAWHGPSKCSYYPSESTESTQDSSSGTAEQLNSFHFTMDDFEYSVQISDLDWDSFFQACEECNMLPPGLAGLDDSGMSDMDDMVNQRTQTATQTTSHDPELQIDGPPDCEGSPVELYLSKYGLSSPDQVLSGSEDDFHLEAVNVFFERLKSVSVMEDHTNLGSNMAGRSEESDVKEDTKEIAVSAEISQSYRNQTAQRNDCHTYVHTVSTDDDLDQEVNKSTCPGTELFIREDDWSLDEFKEGDEREAKMRTQPDKEKSPCNVRVNGKELTDPNQINHQNDHMTQMIAAQIPKADEIMDAPSVEPKAEVANQKVSKKPGISNTSVNSQSEDWTEEKSPSLRSKNVHESQKGINMKAVEILSPGIKGDRNEELSRKGQIKEYQTLMHTTEPDSQLSDYSKSELTMSNILTSGEEVKGQILYVDTPPCFSSKDHDLSPTIVVQHSPSPPPESTGGAKSLEMVDPDPVSQLTPPIYAISSFWNEMEKLTINDILRLRLVGQAQYPSVLLQPEDSSIADVTNAGDSGYFTHSDESKPDHSIRNMSFISDFDGELAQLLSPDAAKLDEGIRESPNPTGILWESDPNLSGTAPGVEDVFNSDTAHSSSLYRNNSNHCFRKMCKNISVQNLQALEGQNLGKILRNASHHSIHSVYSTHSEVEDDYVDPFDRVETSSPVYLSDEEEMDSTGITFSEIIEYLFGTDEPEQSASEAHTIAASYLNGTETSVPEMYDHFFSEFEPENLFYPLADNNSSTNDELVPIFSSSRSATRNVQFPEVYDYFFPDDSPVHSDEDEEPEHTVIRVVTRYDHMPTKNHDSVAASDPHKQFFPEKDNSWNFLWTNPFSFRKVRRTGFTVPPEESSSQALTPVKNTGRSFRGGIQPINILGIDESPFPDPLILSLENRIFRQLAEQQKICNKMQTAVADPRLDAPLLPIKQADMCLVCIAFASWVLKSVNPQGADTWKAVLLANVSALSAIRYLRRFTRDEAAKISPLRQIKPA